MNNNNNNNVVSNANGLNLNPPYMGGGPGSAQKNQALYIDIDDNGVE